MSRRIVVWIAFCTLVVIVELRRGFTLSNLWTKQKPLYYNDVPCHTSTSGYPLNDRLDPFTTMPSNIEEALEMILEARQGTRATFLQIGANDGKMSDPLYGILSKNKSLWIGLQVEPQPVLYSQLSMLHADAPDWAFYHGAVAPPRLCPHGTVTFCETKTPGVGDWMTQGQVNTLVRPHGLRCAGHLHFQTRPCVNSFRDLLYRHASPAFRRYAFDASTDTVNLDLLQIDVEGQDYVLLQMIDWDHMRPHCINYESKILIPSGDDLKAEALLRSKGYYIPEGRKGDTLACIVEQHQV